MSRQGYYQPAAARNLDRPLSRFPLRGQAGGTAASAALRLGQSAGPRRNANQRSGPERKAAPFMRGRRPAPRSGSSDTLELKWTVFKRKTETFTQNT